MSWDFGINTNTKKLLHEIHLEFTCMDQTRKIPFVSSAFFEKKMLGVTKVPLLLTGQLTDLHYANLCKVVAMRYDHAWPNIIQQYQIVLSKV